MQQVWLTTIPLKDQRADNVLESLKEPVESYNRTNGRISKFVIPNLVIGTLDSLMSLSDDLVKVNSQIEVSNNK
jgi:V-type H+-transporting ATPase subunit C